MNLSKLDHYTIDTSKPDETVYFYTKILGLENRPSRRPDSDHSGTWIFLGEYPVVHVNFVDERSFGKTGALDHVAFEGHEYKAYCHHFQKHGVTFKTVESPHLGLAQIYVTDPNDVRIEINIRGEQIDACPASWINDESA